MVSTDGPEINPDEPDPEDGSTHQPAGDQPASEEGQATTATEESAHESNGSANGATRTKRRRKKKTDDASRRRTRIDRLLMEFQPDAVEMEHRKVAGGLRWTLFTVIFLLAGIVIWATWAEVDRLVVAEGKLVTPGNPVVIQSATTSEIKSIDVKFGQVVNAGDVVVHLDPTFSQADVAKLEKLVNGLTAKYERLKAEQSQTGLDVTGHEDDPVWLTEQQVSIDRRQEYTAKLDEFAAERRKLDAQRNRNLGEIEDLKVRVETRQKLYDTVVGLSQRGAAPETEVLSNKSELGYTRQLLNTAENQLIETDAEIDALAKRKESFIAGTRSKISVELAETRQQLESAGEDLNKARRATEMALLRVPEDEGYEKYEVVEVADVSVAQQGNPIVRLIPQTDDKEYEAEVKVQVQDIGHIKVGLPVRIKLSAFPYMKYGTLRGEVREISEDVFEEGQAPMILTYYKVRVSVTKNELRKAKLRDDSRLIPGMAATAEIKVGKRRVIDYFLYPVLRHLDSSIREP